MPARSALRLGNARGPSPTALEGAVGGVLLSAPPKVARVAPRASGTPRLAESNALPIGLVLIPFNPGEGASGADSCAAPRPPSPVLRCNATPSPAPPPVLTSLVSAPPSCSRGSLRVVRPGGARGTLPRVLGGMAAGAPFSANVDCPTRPAGSYSASLCFPANQVPVPEPSCRPARTYGYFSPSLADQCRVYGSTHWCLPPLRSRTAISRQAPKLSADALPQSCGSGVPLRAFARQYSLFYAS